LSPSTSKRKYRRSRKANLGLDPAGVPQHGDLDGLVVKLLRALGGCLGVRRR
jgi:hypothetical protein